jgi:uncharacterized phage-associated protein
MLFSLFWDGRPVVLLRFSVLGQVLLSVSLAIDGGESGLLVGNVAFLPWTGRYAVYMPSVHDVARYILKQQGSISTWKLQKLVYYSQAWHYVWEDERLFPEQIQAWADGPVCPVLYAEHKGKYTIGPGAYKHGAIRNLTDSQRGSIEAVLDFYGDKSGHWLSELTHKEAPWQEARAGLDKNERGHSQITLEAMGKYYAPLDQKTPLASI